jgi:DNA-binding NtrC family response regulator
MAASLLVIDDDPQICGMLKDTFKAEGYDIFIANSASNGIDIIEKEDPDLIFLDIRMPKDMDGMEALKVIKEGYPHSEVIMITAYGEVGTAIKAMKLGAYDYISKPFEMEEIRVLTKKALESSRLKAEVNFLRIEESRRHFQDIIGESSSIQRIFRLIQKIAHAPTSTLLIQGEPGTGRELVARAIHRESSRRDMPFVSVNCSTLTDDQLEAELFGYEKGAFKDDSKRTRGYFEHAKGGTVFLKDIGDMSRILQAKILRVIEEQKITRIGGIKGIDVDVRIIAATSKNIERAVRSMEFNEELYFRLNIVSIELPPLREREDDVVLLTHYFIREGNRQYKKNIRVISKKVIDIFRNYDWPGNIRELKNVIERIMILNNEEVLHIDHLPGEFLYKQKDQDARILQKRYQDESFRSLRKRTIEEFEMNFVKALLEKNKGDIVQSAVDAKLSVTEFKKLVKKYYISPHDFNDS